MKKSKRLLCLVLSLALVFALNVTPAFADEETTDNGKETTTESAATIDGTSYDTLASAFEAASSGDAIILTAGAAVDSTISVSTDVTLDLNGKTITAATTLFKVTSGGALTVTDSSEGGSGTINITSGSDVYFVNGAGADANVAIKSGTINVTSSAGKAVLIWNSSVNISGGTFIVSGSTDAHGIYAKSNETNVSTIEGDATRLTVTYGADDSKAAVSAAKLVSGSVTITGGTYNVSPTSSLLGENYGVTDNDDGTYTVVNKVVATVTVDENTTSYTSIYSALKDANAASSAAVITLTADIELASTMTFSNSNSAAITLDLAGYSIATAESFTGSNVFAVKTEFVLADSSEDSSGSINVSSSSIVAVIDNASTMTFSGGTINFTSAFGTAQTAVIKNSAATASVTMSDSATIAASKDNVSEGTKSMVGISDAGGSITLNGGTITVSSSIGDAYGVSGSGASTEVAVSGGSITASTTASSANAAGIWNAYVAMTDGAITAASESGTAYGIYGKANSESTSSSVSGGTVTVSGSTESCISGTIDLTGGIYSHANVSNWAADGCAVYSTANGTYTVADADMEASVTTPDGTTTYYGIFGDAISAADTDGDTITLLDDAAWTLTATTTIKIGLTFDMNGHTLTMSGNYYVNFQPASSASTVAFVDNSTNGGGKVIGSYGSTSYGMIRITKACTVNLENVYFENQSYGYAMEIGTSGGVIISLNASNCEFVNSNTTTKSSSTSQYMYSYGVKLYGNSASADPASNKLVFTDCTFTTAATNTGYTLYILNGKSGTNSVIELTGCTIVSNGESESWTLSTGSTVTTTPAALALGTSFCSKLTVTDCTITADSARAISVNYSTYAASDITLGDGNTVTGPVSLGNGTASGASSYTINVTGGFFDNGDSIPFVVSSESGTSLTTLVNVTGGYYKVDVSSVAAACYSCVSDTTYSESGYQYKVSSDSNASDDSVAFTVGSDGTKTYYNTLYDAVHASDSAAAVYFFEDCELTSDTAKIVASSGKTIYNYGNVTLTYNGTLSSLVSEIKTSTGTGSVSAVSLVYNYDYETTHSISGAVLTGSGLTSGGVTNMKMTDETNWNYYAADGILADGYVYLYNTTTSPNYTVAEADSSSAQAVIGDCLYCKSFSAAIALASNKSYVDCTVTLLTDVTTKINLNTANYKVVIDLNECTLNGYVYVVKSNVNLTVKNGSIIADESDGFAIYTNGSYTGETLELDNVTVENESGYAIYLAADGETAIKDCTITGIQSGIEVRSGDLKVADSTITSTTADFVTQSNGNGTTVYGAGIAVSQHTTKQDINVTITDSEISGYYGIYEINYNSDYDDSAVAISISGVNTKISGTGTDAAAVYSVSLTGANDSDVEAATNSITTVAITGGYFTSDPSDYVVENYEIATNDDEDYPYYVADVIVGKNIDLSAGKITLNVYVSGDDIDSDSGVNSISMSPYDESASGHAEFSATEGSTSSGAAYSYIVTQDVVAKKMADTLTVTVALSNDYAVAYETSVMVYANELLEELDETNDADTIAVLKAMLNYGAAAQTYSGYNTDNLANAGNAYTNTELSNISPSGSISKSAGDNYNGATVKSASMTFNADFTINLTYTASLESGYTVAVTSGGTTYEAAISGTKVIISGLSALDLNNQFEITLTYDSKTYTVTMDGLYYAKLLSQQSNTNYATLGKTIYQYATTVKTLAEADAAQD